MAANWRNPADNLDVDADGAIAPIDALIVINEINRAGSHALASPKPSNAAYLDPQGDDFVAPIDALIIINHLNEVGGGYRTLRAQGGFESHQDITVTVSGQDQGARIYSASIDASLDPTTADRLLPDLLSVYLVDPTQSDVTLLDRGTDGTSLFSLSAAGTTEMATGLTTWDGHNLEIDLTGVQVGDTAILRFQLLAGNTSSTSRVQIRPLSNSLDASRVPSTLVPDRNPVLERGNTLNLAGLAASNSLTSTLTNVRFDAASGRLLADFELRNTGESIGRTLAMVLPGLPAGVTLPGASGVDALGRPYLNITPAIRNGGLGRNERSNRIQVEISNPSRVPLDLQPELLTGPAERAPELASIPDQTVMPGDAISIALTGTDPDGDSLSHSVRRVGADGALPTARLDDPTRILTFTPTPSQIGRYQVEVVATDGVLETSRTFNLTVVADPITTTRISGRVLDVDGSPLVGMPVEVGTVETLTDSTGRFLLDMGPGPLVAETLRVRGNEFATGVTYPFIAEKLPLLLQHDAFPGFENKILRPIYLPKLDVAHGTTIDPAQDTTVAPATLPGASLKVVANSLFTQQGTPFTGTLSITEVPPNLTPAALPERLRTDLVVTVQPGDMVFTTPAPITFPNRAGWAPGTLLDLWSINPVTGQFDDVGDMRVSDDGQTIVTISGGVRTSSWHLPALPPVNPGNKGPAKNGNNRDPNAAQPCGAATKESNSETCLFTGGVTESHTTAAYQSAGESRAVTLVYSSLRADARPIIHFGLDNAQTGANSLVSAMLTVQHDGLAIVASGGSESPISYWRVPDSPNGVPIADIDMALQVDLTTQPTGVYEYQLDYGPGLWTGTAVASTAFSTNSRLLHVNSRDSAFGAGWSIDGLQQLFRQADGSLLLVDGGGSEQLYRWSSVAPDVYQSPAGDFSTLTRLANGDYQRRSTDGMIDLFRASDGKLVERRDRNSNRTLFIYDNVGNLIRITDPADLSTELTYTNGKLSAIHDPVGRTTQISIDSAGNLVQTTDPDGTTRTWSYDTRHLMAGEVDQRGASEQSRYDEFGREFSVVRKDGTTMQFFPAATHGLVLREATVDPTTAPFATLAQNGVSVFVDGRGVATTYDLNRSGLINNQRDAVGASGIITRDQDQLVRQSVDARGYTTTYQYDARGNPTSIVDDVASPRDLFADREYRLSADAIRGFTSYATTLQTADFDGDGVDDVLVGQGTLGFQLFPGRESGDYLSPQIFLPPPDAANMAYDPLSNHYVADVDHDGDPDVVGVSRGLITWINQGDGTFVTSPVSGLLTDQVFFAAAELADFNQDGWLDLVRAIAPTVTHDGAGGSTIRETYQLFLGAGDGTFQPGAVLIGSAEPNGGFYAWTASVDFDGDGAVDLIVGAGDDDARLMQRLLIFHGRGDGTFAPAESINTNIPLDQAALSAFSIVDLDQDADLDVVLASGWLMRNDGANGYTTLPIGPAHSNTYYAPRDVLADIDQDGDLDIIKALNINTTSDCGILVWRNDGNFQFTEIARRSLINNDGFPSRHVLALADADRDGIPDVLRLGGDGFTRSRLEELSDNPLVPVDQPAIGGMLAADLTGDGRDDFIFWSDFGASLSPSVPATGVALGPPETFSTQVIREVKVADFDSDHDQDVLTYDVRRNPDTFEWEQYLSRFTNDGAGNLMLAEDRLIGLENSSAELAVGDIDGDGDPDIVIGRGPYDSALLVRNNGGAFGLFTPLGFALSFTPQLVDINGDGLADLVYPRYNPPVGIRLADRTGTFGPEALTGVVTTTSLSLADTTGDGVPDLITSLRGGPIPNMFTVLPNNGAQFTAPTQSLDSFRGGLNRTIIPVDIDGDGDNDLATMSGAGAVTFYMNDGRGTFSDGDSYALDGLTNILAVGVQVVFTDLDHDGFLDIVYPRFAPASNSMGLGYRLNHRTDLAKRFTYDPLYSQLTSATDELGRTTLYDVDPANGNTRAVTQVTGAPGGPDDLVTHYTYGAYGLVDTITDAAGRVTDYDYDALGRLTAVTFAQGTPDAASQHFGYDLVGNLTAATDENGHRTEMQYDAMNRLIRRTLPDPNGVGPLAAPVETFSYDAVGNVSQSTDPLNNTTTYHYDPLDRLIQQVDALGSARKYSYDPAGNLTSATDELQRVGRYRYDVRNRLISTIDPLGGATNYSYDSNDELTVVTDPNGHRTRTLYDARGRTVASIDPLGNSTRYTYDVGDDLIAVIDANGHRDQFSYDDLGRVVSQANAVGAVTTLEYDRVGNQVAQIDPLGRRTLNEYDARDRLVATTDALGGVIRYQYDAVGNLTALTDPVHNTTQFSYDALDRLIAEENTLHDVRRYRYDGNGNLVGLTDRDGRVREFTYDALNRRTAELWRDDQGQAVLTFDYAYDAAGQLKTASDPDSSYAYTYDADGRLTSTSNAGTPGVPNVVFAYTYDAAGNKLTRRDQLSGQTAGVNAYAYDAANRQTRITQSGPGVAPKRVDLRYNAVSAMTGVTRFADLAGNQRVATSNYTYDANNRLTDLVHRNNVDAVLAEYHYTFDLADRILHIDSTDGSSDDTYDDTDQLTGADYSFQPDETYSYDLNGNRTMPGYVTGANNRLLSDGTYNYEYDPEGNRTRRTEIATGNVTEYSWDYRNRLTHVVFKDSSGTVTRDASYTYDVFDRRLAKAVNLDGFGPEAASVDRFVYDGPHIALQFDASGSLTHRYLHGPIVDQLLADEGAMNGVIWPVTDLARTATDFVGNDGRLVGMKRFDAFGNIVVGEGDVRTAIAGFKGREIDDEIGLVYFRSRYFDSVSGRFLSEDWIGFGGSDANLNRFVGNSPLQFVDPWGLKGESSTVGSIGGKAKGGQKAVFRVDVEQASKNVHVQGKFEKGGDVRFGGEKKWYFDVSSKETAIEQIEKSKFFSNNGRQFKEDLAKLLEKGREKLAKTQLLSKSCPIPYVRATAGVDVVTPFVDWAISGDPDYWKKRQRMIDQIIIDNDGYLPVHDWFIPVYVPVIRGNGPES